MKDIVSVITSFYDTEDYILQCINSVNNQLTNENFLIEYILIDDCSTDSTKEIIDLYFDQYKNENVIVKKLKTENNVGPGCAKKLGIEQATGNYFMFLDADDYYIKNDFILRAYTTITENNVDIVEYGIRLTNERGIREEIVSSQSLIIENNKESNLLAIFYSGLIKFMPWSKIIKREIVKSKEYDNDKQFDDIRTIPYWAYNANRIIIENTVEVNYRNKLNSIVRNNSLETRLGTVGSIASLFEDFKDNKSILKAMYDRCLLDLRTMLDLDSNNEYFRKMSKLNTYMLSYIYPDNYKEITYDVE